VGAGTVEFIVDAQLKHYFLEMNTRLQVEHPVTECITGLDLVEWQLRVAAGEPLPLRQDEIRFTGHAIEARLYAEDPYDGFKPQTGRIGYWQPERAVRGGVRIDGGIAEGGEVTPYYDAMVAKVIAHGRDRSDAIRRLQAALEDAPLLGLKNNARFLRDLLACDEFGLARMTTTLLDEWQAGGAPLYQRPQPSDEAWCIAAALRVAQHGAGWRPASVSNFAMRLWCDGVERRIRVHITGPTSVRANEHEVCVHALGGPAAHIEINGVHQHLTAIHAATHSGPTLHLVHQGTAFTFTEPSDFPDTDATQDPQRALAPVAGVVTQVAVAVGDTVSEGQPLACVEAMKMEMWLHARAAGVVRAVHVHAGEPVAAAALLVELET
jgi:geranyl-CoA carboxylase alpha subunit